MTGQPYQFNYQIMGDENCPKLLFIHGFMGDMIDWKEVVELLKDRYQCMVLDLPGHGQTQVRHPRGYRFAECASGISELLKNLKYYPSFLIGYSLGGRLALQLALNSAELFLGVIIESASAGIEEVAERNERRKNDLMLASQLQLDWPEFLYIWYDQPLFKRTRLHEKFFKLMQRRKKNSPQQLALVLEGMGQGVQNSLWSRLPDIMKDVYLFVGGEDTKYVALSEKMAKKLPNGSRVLFDGCSHNIHFEDPERFAAELDQIVQS